MNINIITISISNNKVDGNCRDDESNKMKPPTEGRRVSFVKGLQRQGFVN